MDRYSQDGVVIENERVGSTLEAIGNIQNLRQIYVRENNNLKAQVKHLSDYIKNMANGKKISYMDGAIYMAQRVKDEVIDQMIQKCSFISQEFKNRVENDMESSQWIVQALDSAMSKILEAYNTVHQGAVLLRKNSERELQHA